MSHPDSSREYHDEQPSSFKKSGRGAYKGMSTKEESSSAKGKALRMHIKTSRSKKK